MNCKIVEVNPSAPAKPRTWTREELENGTAPEGLYSDRYAVGHLLVYGKEKYRQIDYLSDTGPEKADDFLWSGPFTHVGTVDVTLRLDRSKAVR